VKQENCDILGSKVVQRLLAVDAFIRILIYLEYRNSALQRKSCFNTVEMDLQQVCKRD